MAVSATLYYADIAIDAISCMTFYQYLYLGSNVSSIVVAAAVSEASTQDVDEDQDDGHLVVLISQPARDVSTDREKPIWNKSDWSNYETGIFSGCPKDAVVNHSVPAIEHCEEKGRKYWLIQNSWGDDWGEDGHIRLFRHDKEPSCGMNNDPQAGVACKGKTDPVPVCGKCEDLFDSVVPHFKAAMSTTVEEFTLSYCSLDTAKATVIAKELPRFTAVKKINMSGNWGLEADDWAELRATAPDVELLQYCSKSCQRHPRQMIGQHSWKPHQVRNFPVVAASPVSATPGS